ncbi:MAG: SpoIIE family protein phosphatase [Spirochaetaceae bacterium]|nr:SpoIIE family protein phosphatase [Spirochaetaceae bacterium]
MAEKKLRKTTLRERILIPAIISMLCETALLGTMFVVSIFIVKSIVISGSDKMGDSAAVVSSNALELQLRENIQRHAEDMAAIIDERLLNIQNFSKLISELTTNYFSEREHHKPRVLPLSGDEDLIGGDGETDLYISSGAAPRVESEAYIAANVTEILSGINSLDEDITASYVAGDSGYFIISRVDRMPLGHYDARKRVWYITTKNNNKLTWSDVYADIAGRGPTITCAAPFYDYSQGKKFMGVAGIGVLLKNFERIIEDAAPGENTVVFILTKDGTKLFSSDGSGITTDKTGNVHGENLLQSGNAALSAIAGRMTKGEHGITELSIDGNLKYLAFFPLTTLDWSLGVIADERIITGPVNTMKADLTALSSATKAATNRAIIILLLSLVLLSAAIAGYRLWSVFMLSGRIVKPITQLVKQVELTGKGNLTDEVLVNSKAAEILQLAASFNNMKTRLREYIDNLALVTKQKERMSAELDVAAKIQNSMLPSGFIPPESFANDFEIDAKMISAREVGGDFYDYFFIDDTHFAIIIADVSGKGVSAAMFMLITKTLVKNHLEQKLSLEDVMTKLNQQLCENNDEGLFVSMWAGVFNIQRGILEYINAGHNPPLVKSGSYSFRYLSGLAHDLVLGVKHDTLYHKRLIHLSKGDAIFLYTDGITEAFNPNDIMYGEERLSDFLNTHYSTPLNELLIKLYEDIKEFAADAEQSDDITMLTLRCLRITTAIESHSGNDDDAEEIEELA